MHEHMEVIIPPTATPIDDVAKVLAPFDENRSVDEYGEYNHYAFWDWYVIGGRWSGDHIVSAINKDDLKSFQDSLPAYKVSCLQSAGWLYEKPVEFEDDGASIDTLVDIWDERFPEFAGKCPFWGLTDQYASLGTDSDVMEVGELSSAQECSRLMICWNSIERGIVPIEMLQAYFWNGVSYCESSWNGNVKQSIAEHNAEKLSNSNYDWFSEYGNGLVVGDDWLAVTVDYHS